MDDVISALTEFCGDARSGQLPADIVDAVTARLVDSIGCAVGGGACEAARIGRRLAPVVRQAGNGQLTARSLGAAG